jgi:hypothetical protein
VPGGELTTCLLLERGADHYVRELELKGARHRSYLLDRLIRPRAACAGIGHYTERLSWRHRAFASRS